MSLKIIIGLISAILFFSCKNRVEEFEFVEYLEDSPVLEIEILSKGNVYIDVVDTFLVVVKSNEPFIEIYSTVNHQKLAAFGMEGRGPLDFLSSSLVKSNSSDSNSRVFFVHDFKRNKIAIINIDSVLSDYKNYELRPIPKTNDYLTFVHYLSNQYLIGTPSQNGMMSLIDVKNKKNTLISYSPALDYSVPTQSLSTIYRPAVLVNEEESLIVVAPLYLGEVNFFNFEGDVIKNVLFQSRDNYKEELMQGEGAYSEIKEQITELKSSKDLIYALNSNTAVKNFRNDKRNPKIQVFNWSGEPVKEYLLGNRHIFSFAIDTLNNRMYGYDMNAEKNNIILYDF